MRIKKFSYYVIMLLALTVVLIGIATAINFYLSVDIKNENNLINYIERRDKVNNISITKQSDYQEIHCILYTFNGTVRLFILEKSLIPNHYKYFGGSYSSSNFGTYNFGDKKGALIIVYGDNSKYHANKYTMKNGTITYSEDIQNMDYVLRVFRIPDSFDINSNLYLYNSKDNLIGAK